jgi:hypothetical protein
MRARWGRTAATFCGVTATRSAMLVHASAGGSTAMSSVTSAASASS